MADGTTSESLAANQSQAQTDGLLRQAELLLEAGDRAGSFLLVKDYWLNHFDNQAAIFLLARILASSNKRDLADKLKQLPQPALGETDQARLLFEIGYMFIDEREFELAAVVLKRCTDLVPAAFDAHYEMGFALMNLRRFTESIKHFEIALQNTEDFDTRLNLSVCYTLTRELTKARSCIDAMAQSKLSPEEQKELDLRLHVLRRMEKFTAEKELKMRDWFYILYGGVLFNESLPRDFKGNLRQAPADYHAVASTLLILKFLLQELGHEIDVIEYYSYRSRPLAEALAHLMDISVDSFGGADRPERSLLLMCWASDIVGPHKVFTANNGRRTLFAYGLSSQEPLPVTPDVVGCIAEQCDMPWFSLLNEANLADRTEKQIKDHPTYNEIRNLAVTKIIERAADIESNPEIIEQVSTLTKYYRSKRGLLTILNSAVFTERPEYTAEIPL